ncbi:MAG: hypothetical protein LBV12_00780 [Puniceicoccales bacterium]|jgi:hypothetical protein|nr:hypothetical protein [Puniceicoccales bacterium]
MPHDTDSSDKPQSPSSRRYRLRWLIFSGIIIAGIILYGLTQPTEPGADWFSPIDGPKSQQWAEATQPAKVWTPRTNDTLGVEYELVSNDQGKRTVKITTKNLNSNEREVPRADYAVLIKAGAGNTAILPDGTTVQLSEVIADLGDNKPPSIFKITNGVATPATTSTALIAGKDPLGRPFLQFVFTQTPTNATNLRGFSLYESSTGRFLCGGGNDGDILRTWSIPYMLQSSVELLMECHLGETQQLTIPAILGNFAEKDGIVIRYCGDIIRKANEDIEYALYPGSPPKDLFSSRPDNWFMKSRLIFQSKPNRVFIFTQAIGSLEILSAEAILENGKKVILKEVSLGYSESFRAFQSPEDPATPIHSFVLTLPQRSARVAFTIPQIPELWPDQGTRNRFDLRFSAAEAAQFKFDTRSSWIHTLDQISGVIINIPQDTFKERSLNDVDLTGKSIREAFVLYLQRNGIDPKEHTTAIAIDRKGSILFEPRKPMGVYIWRWLYRHPSLMRWIDDNNLHGWLEKLGIKPE